MKLSNVMTMYESLTVLSQQNLSFWVTVLDAMELLQADYEKGASKNESFASRERVLQREYVIFDKSGKITGYTDILAYEDEIKELNDEKAKYFETTVENIELPTVLLETAEKEFKSTKAGVFLPLMGSFFTR